MSLTMVAGIYGLLGIVTVVVFGLLAALIIMRTGSTKGLRDLAVVARALRGPRFIGRSKGRR